MSWDVVLFSSKEKIILLEDVDESKLIPTDFGLAFENHFDDIIQNGGHREIRGKDFSIDYFHQDEPTTNMMLSLYGEAALFELIPLSIKNNWQIFDTGAGEMIDLTQPAKNGYKKFLNYLNQILKK